MKILTVAGTRPELIRLSIIIEKLDKLVDHTFVYTNQNYDHNLSKIFFKELGIRKPDYYFKHKAKSVPEFLSKSMTRFEEIIAKEAPEKILMLGDTNSGLLAMIPAKMGIPVYHMEAGNRCRDERVPEEMNRRIIDSFSKYNLPYTENSKQNLIMEGYDKNHVFRIGNPIYEVLTRFKEDIDNSKILKTLGIEPGEFVLVTAHRAENVDDDESLINIMSALDYISNSYKVIFSVHPRTRGKLDGFTIPDNLILSKPFGLFDFVKLEKSAKVVISDSGTVQEECCIYGVPSITIRRTTERQETIECGSNILSGTSFPDIKYAFNSVLIRDNKWIPPIEYLAPNVSDTVINILLGR